MPRPASADVHVDKLLTNLSIGYINTSYIADRLFPVVPVLKQSDIVPKYDKSHWFRDDAQLRRAGSKSAGGGWTVDVTAKYFADRYSYRKEVDDETRDNADDPFDLDRDATNFVTDKMLMKREVRWATDFFTTGVWTGDKTGGSDFTVWSDYAASSPLVDVTTYKDVVEGRIAVEPKDMTIGKEVWSKLKWHPDLIDTIKHTQKGQMTVDLAAGLFEVDNINVGRAIYTTTADGTAEASVTYSRIWGKHCLLLYVPKTPSLQTPAAGYTFIWKRVANALQYIKRMRDEEREVDIIEGNSYFDQKATAVDAGIFLSGAVA